MAEEQNEQQQQPFDQEAFLARMGQSIKESLSQIQPTQPEYAQPEQPQQVDETEQFLNPYLQPVIRQSNFAAASAVDYTKFYTKHRVVADEDADIAEGTISQTMEKEIETLFEQMAKNNRPASREEIRNYLLGRDIASNPKQFAERANKRRDAAIKRAQGASDIGAMNQVSQLSQDQLLTMSQDQLTKSLENMTF